ncbi:MAG: class I SAM-dependent methyltransferase [Anaerolineales bacterium]|nr:class I SAM-dependent methyltransferase [Anaerolineales bacterium]MCB9127992.1 class I SAM-dependent methyltransferase [Ardenticatenales bacterium]MCB9172008.1 class I SAM-dependent methyltransferase [Ardenticatenales bacterium]
MTLGTFLSYLPGPLLRRLLPYIRLADLRHSIESLIVEAWLHETAHDRRILVVGSDPLLHLPLVHDGATLVGLSTDPQTVKEAHRLARRMGISDSVHFHVSDLLHLPFEAGYFDAVLCGDALARSTDELFILREMTRVLKSGGILGLTLPSFEAAGIVTRYLPRHWLSDDLAKQPVSAGGGPAPAVDLATLTRDGLRERAGLRRLYRYPQMSTRLELLGLEIADHGPYLTRLGAAFYEAFSALDRLDRRRGMARWLFASLSPLFLAPAMIVDASSQQAPGYGLRLAAIKRSDHGNLPRFHDEGGGFELPRPLPRQRERGREPMLA